MVSRISKIWNSSRPPMRVRVTPWTCCKTILNFMTGRRRPRTRALPPSALFQLRGGRQWLWVGVALCSAALADPPPPAPASPASPVPVSSPASAPGAPDDDFIEFLGADDVGDAAWWEFLKKVPPQGGNPPATPPQEAKQ